MKKFFLSVLVILIAINNIQADNEKPIKSKIEKATVFLDGAQVFRTGTFSISQGVTKLVFDGVSPQIVSSSIQVNGTGNFTILDVKYFIQYPEPDAPLVMPAKIIQDIRLLEDSIEMMNFDLEGLNLQKQVLDAEKNMLANHKIMRGEGHSDTMPVLREALEYFRQRMFNINSELMKNKLAATKTTKTITKMRERLQKLNNYNAHHGKPNDPAKQPSHQVHVTVSADAPVSGTLTANYMVRNAGWSPLYDIRAKDVNSQVELTYKANVYQNTGTDWKGVKLTLSTANPNRSNVKPVLPVWYIQYYMARNDMTRNIYEQKEESVATGSTYNWNGAAEMDMAAKQAYATISETIANYEFEIAQTYDIPSDGAGHRVGVLNRNLSAEYYHYIVPKIDKDAFLVARITGWEELSLLPGKANLYYEGTFIGETVINPSAVADTLEIALGRDKSIIAERRKLKDKEREEIIGKERIKTITYELSFRNTKNGKINLKIEDQVPVSLIAEIKVSLLDQGSADFNKDTGMLSWDVDLKSKESKKFTFTYSIKYDKDKPLLGNL